VHLLSPNQKKKDKCFFQIHKLMTYMSFTTCALHHLLWIWLVLLITETSSEDVVVFQNTVWPDMWKRRTEDTLIPVFSQHAIQNTVQGRWSFYYLYIRITPEFSLRIFKSNHCISNETTLYSNPPSNEEYFDNHFLLQHQTAIPVSNWNNMYCFNVTYFTLYAVDYIVC
jgi:hypothetical protein